jgi:hypothetical protein
MSARSTPCPERWQCSTAALKHADYPWHRIQKLTAAHGSAAPRVAAAVLAVTHREYDYLFSFYDRARKNLDRHPNYILAHTWPLERPTHPTQPGNLTLRTATVGQERMAG